MFEIFPKNCAKEMFQKIFQQVKWKKTEFNGDIYDFSVEYDDTDVDDILDIHKYLMKMKDIVQDVAAH